MCPSENGHSPWKLMVGRCWKIDSYSFIMVPFQGKQVKFGGVNALHKRWVYHQGFSIASLDVLRVAMNSDPLFSGEHFYSNKYYPNKFGGWVLAFKSILGNIHYYNLPIYKPQFYHTSLRPMFRMMSLLMIYPETRGWWGIFFLCAPYEPMDGQKYHGTSGPIKFILHVNCSHTSEAMFIDTSTWSSPPICSYI